MLTRLRVNGFKNLVDVDVRFGPFTCIAGPNAVGKSNLFDAIRFLSALADEPLINAAKSVRDEEGKTADVRGLFHCVGDKFDDEISLEAEMIVPRQGVDDLGQVAIASTTFLRYAVTLAYRSDSLQPSGKLEILKEELAYIKKGEAKEKLLFPHKLSWRNSAVTGARFGPYFISTADAGPNRVIRLHNDVGGGENVSANSTTTAAVTTKKPSKSGGRPSLRLATNLPRTVLSVTNAAESPTALLARNEMRSWRLLQLEPSALRKPDELFTSPATLGADGSHLAATLYRLALSNGRNNGKGVSSHEAASQVYGQIASRLSELIEDVYEITVDRDEQRRLLTLLVTNRDGTSHPARALSDGTLRFLALSILELDPEAQGLICLEEPENGIHPTRIPSILRLLQDIATDVNRDIDLDNPLRQVIVNTHSPSVVAQVPDDSLLVAELKETIRKGETFKRVSFSPLPGTWREKAPEKVTPVPRGKLMSYLNPVAVADVELEDEEADTHGRPKIRRVIDREDLQLLLPYNTERQ